jgi:hypothetical protein
MDQKLDRISPLFINTDKSYKNLLPEEASFITGMSIDINANPGDNIGTSNPTGEGQNDLILTPTRSNEELPNVLKPAGNNKNEGSFESVTTQELYYFNFNSNGNHGIYVVDGNTGLWYKVIVDPELAFSDEQEHFIADHRCRLRLTKDSDGNVLEKYLILTDGKNWQKYINVRAAIATDGFNASLFPYWTLQPPHFDRRELFEYAIRPPMYAPIAVPIPNTSADSGVQNRVIDQSFQFAIAFQNTDGRLSTLSPYSLPYNTISESFLNDPENIPKKGKLTLYAGSPMTEKILIYVRLCGGDWSIYETIEKFSSCGANDPSVIGNKFWLRTGQWADYNYDSNLNTIEFVFDNSKVSQIIDPKNANRLQNDMPQLSVGMTDLEDAIGLVNNRYGYPNFGCEVTDKFDVIVKEKEDTGCTFPLRKIKLYVYVGRERGNRSQNTPNQSPERNIWISQVGYYIGEDTQMRFGGTGYENDEFFIDTDESKYFELDFADRDGFICYLKGTPYSSTCKWYQVKADLSLTPLDGLLNSQNTSDTSFIQNVYQGRGFFVGVFEFTVPAGRYNATIGRHNVASTSDYRSKSTYIFGIGNSRIVSTSSYGNAPYPIASLKLNSIVSYSKEMEIDCVNGDVDVWGRGAEGDVFYIACPFQGAYDGRNRWSWVEGYLYEQRDNLIPIELFPNRLFPNQIGSSNVYTDKNGFFWGYTWGLEDSHMDANTLFTVKLNCVYPSNFTVQNNSPDNSGWKQNGNVYLSDFNGGEVGDCNRIIYSGKITSLDGLTNYSNIAISIVDGQTVYTRSDGTFDLIVHNGQNNIRVSNVYVNTGGNFLITLAGCGQIPVFQFIEPECILNYNDNCMVRRFFPNLNLNVNIESSRINSLKENGRYSIGIAGADLAGRIMAVNLIKDLNVPSFLQRDNLSATYFQLLIQALNLSQQYPDIKWIMPYVSKNIAVLKYVDWVGDAINYLDSNGNIVNDPASAVFCSIRINSLYNFNIANNFSPLSKYQFVEGDRLRVFDDGDGNLFDVATYGDPIDMQIFGTNYNQAAINAGLQVPQENTILNPTAEQQNENLSITLIVKYDSRLTKLIGKTGFWIEIYTPTKVSDNIPYCEVKSYPVINGQLAEFIGFTNGQPVYNFPTEINLDFWDTYFLQRTIAIPDVGSKYFNHPFQSPNITDYWGANCTSCGRQNAKDDNAMQRWFGGDTIKSDAFVGEGIINGLGTFRTENRKDYGTYPYGAIISAHTKRNLVAFICENDWFIVSYNQPYSKIDPTTGYLKTNPGGLSEPQQKTGDIFGCSPQDTSTIIIDDQHFFWLDSKNTGWIKCDYQNATDISQQDDQRGERGGVQSYLNAKIGFIEKWNYAHALKDRFDKVAGIDSERGNVYLTFRPRRDNTNNINSYVTGRRNISLGYQETIVYNIQYRAWIPFSNFAPESYARLRGKWANVEFISFAQGKPYIHNNTPNNSFLKFYGVQTQPSIIGVIGGDKADKELAKTFANLSYESNPNVWAVDMAYTDFINSFTYVPANFFKRKGGIYFGPLLQNGNSYPPIDPDRLFRSMLVDGYGMRNMYLVFRLVGQFDKLNEYNELKSVYCLYSLQPMNQK